MPTCTEKQRDTLARIDAIVTATERENPTPIQFCKTLFQELERLEKDKTDPSVDVRVVKMARQYLSGGKLRELERQLDAEAAAAAPSPDASAGGASSAAPSEQPSTPADSSGVP